MTRILLGFILFLELTSTAFAYKIHNGRIIKHREWTTGNIQIIDSKPTKAFTLNFKEMMSKHSTINKDGILLRNKVFGETGSVGTETLVDGYINLYIEHNNSDVPKTYEYYSSFCVDNHCVKNTYEIQLDPGGIFEIQTKRAISLTFDKPGHHKTLLTSLVDSDDLNSVFATDDEGYIDIVE